MGLLFLATLEPVILNRLIYSSEIEAFLFLTPFNEMKVCID